MNLRNLLLPLEDESSFPAYSKRPEFLAPDHCRLCLAPTEAMNGKTADEVLVDHLRECHPEFDTEASNKMPFWGVPYFLKRHV